MTQTQRAEKYAADMKPLFDERLMRDRSALVKAYRDHPASWPGGIDSRYDRWYRAEEWTDAGVFVGAAKPVTVVHPVTPEAETVTPIPVESVTPSTIVTLDAPSRNAARQKAFRERQRLAKLEASNLEGGK